MNIFGVIGLVLGLPFLLFDISCLSMKKGRIEKELIDTNLSLLKIQRILIMSYYYC